MGLVGALVLALAALPQEPALDAPAADVATRVEALLLATDEPVDARRRALAELGPDALEVLLDELAAEELASKARSLALDVFAEVGDDVRTPFLASAVEVEDEDASRSRALLAILRGAGRSADLPVALAAGEHMVARGREGVGAAVADAVEEMLRRDERGWVGIESHLNASTPLVADGFRRALGRIGGEGAARVLLGLLGRNPERDPLVLGELAGVLAGTVVRLGDDDLAQIRRYLDDDSRRSRAAAASAVGALGDTDALDELVSMLQDESVDVRVTALRSLQQLTGLRYGEDAERWERWREAERAWFRAEGVEVLAELGAFDAARVCTALTEIGRHRYRRRELVEAVLPLFSHRHVAVRRTAVATLASLGDSGAAPALVPLLDDEPPVVAATHAALRALTGLDLPADREIWHDSLRAGAGSWRAPSRALRRDGFSR